MKPLGDKPPSGRKLVALLWPYFKPDLGILGVGAGALLVRGRLEVGDGGVINVVAEHIAPLSVGAKVAARNFR